MRNENSPVPGFEGEFTGMVGKEKRVHKTHFQLEDGVSLRETGYNTGNKWVQRGRKWILVKQDQGE